MNLPGMIDPTSRTFRDEAADDSDTAKIRMRLYASSGASLILRNWLNTPLA